MNDDELRNLALDAAIGSMGPGRPASEIVECATAFYNFLSPVAGAVEAPGHRYAASAFPPAEDSGL